MGSRERPNIHYLGERMYSDFPYLKGFDVCLSPIALCRGALCKPCKLREYLATWKTIVPRHCQSPASVDLVEVATSPWRFLVRSNGVPEGT